MIDRPTATDRSPSQRAGRVGCFLLGTLLVTFLFGILVINSYFVTETRAQQEDATDAAALAAAHYLAHEAFLYGHPGIYDMANCPMPLPCPDPQNDCPPIPDLRASLFCQATQAAVGFGRKNFVAGTGFEVRRADVFFDYVNIPKREIEFTLTADPDSEFHQPLTLAQLRHLNSAQVAGKRTCERNNADPLPIIRGGKWPMITRSQAVLDGNIYGFHTDPRGAINIPLVPLALPASGWREQVESGVDPTFANPPNGPLAYGDFRILLGANAIDPDRHKHGVYAPLLLIGTTSATEAISQFHPAFPGITPAQYGTYLALNHDHPFALDLAKRRLPVPGLHLSQDLSGNLAHLQELLTALREHKTRLIWPLYSEFANGEVVITGFVAARIVDISTVPYSISLDNHGNPVPNGKAKGHSDQNPHHPKNQGKGNGQQGKSCVEFNALQLTLHPTLLATNTGMVIVRDWPQDPFRFPNAYVKRIRLMK